MKKIVVVSSSYRHGGNSFTLAQKFSDGAIESGNEVQFISLKELNLKYCTGCLSCQKTSKCVLNDGMNGIYTKISEADILVFATPVYYYSISGQLKTFLDRLNPLFTRNNNFKSVYLLLSAAEEDITPVKKVVSPIEGFIECFDGLKLKEVLYALGVTDIGDINNTKYLDMAYLLGKNI